MKNISINLLTNIVLLLAGLLLIIFYNQPDLLDWVARILGVMFMLPSIAYLMSVAMRHSPSNTSGDYLGVLPAVGGLCFGIIMLARPQLFSGVLSICMGALLIVLGVFHIIYLFLSRHTMPVRGWYYLLPLVVTTCGLAILFVDSIRTVEPTVVLMTGVCLLLFNITSLQEYRALRKARNNHPTLPRIDDNDETDDSGRNCDNDPEAEKYLHTEI